MLAILTAARAARIMVFMVSLLGSPGLGAGFGFGG
jgi:hypothetical protein